MSTTATATALLAVPLLVVRLGLFVRLHLIRRDLSPVRNTVSDLGTGRSRRMYTIMGVLTAVGYLLILVAAADVGLGPRTYLVIGGIGVLAQLLTLIAPTDLTGTGRTRTGRIHLLLAVVQFTCLFVTMVNLDLTGLPTAGMQDGLRWVVRVSFYVFLVTLVVPGLRHRWLGLTERVFLVVSPLWFLVLAVALLAR
ncbi:MAG: DUF998 domain-containing protein [Corynebacterium nuruki]|jgi:hypothetical membrane protein|nr:DUF998 domain-containing protein [Corynebacterium nuruki]